MMTKWIELTSATDGGKFMLNAEAIESVSPRGEDFENNWYETIVTTIGSSADAYFCVGESYEQIKAMLTGGCYVGGSAKHSRWSVDEYGDCTCENCGWESSEDSDFCPGCGADMREEGEGHEAD